MGIINTKDNRNSRDSVLSSSYQGLQNTVKQDGYISTVSLYGRGEMVPQNILHDLIKLRPPSQDIPHPLI